MFSLSRRGTGSSISLIIIVALSVLTAASVAYVGKNTYDSNSKSTKIVNELSSNSPNIDNLKSLGLVDPTKVNSGSEVNIVRVDDIYGIKEIRITNAETGAIIPANVNGLEFDYPNVSYANGSAIVKYSEKTNSSVFASASTGGGNSCSASSTANGSVTEGTPTSNGQALQGTNSSNACYVACNFTYSWNDLTKSCGSIPTGTNFGTTTELGLFGRQANVFNGTSDYVEFPGIDTTDNKWSVMFRFKYSSTGHKYMAWFQGGDMMGPQGTFYFKNNWATAGRIELYEGWDGGGEQLYSTATGLNDGNWHSLVYSHDGTSYKLYIDGTEDSTGSVHGIQLYSAGMVSNRLGEAGGSGYHYDGRLQDFFLLDYAVSPTEASDYHAGNYNAVSALLRY